MKTAIILHGMPSKEEYFDPKRESPSNMHWIPWAQRQLLLNGVLAQAIELPEPYAPIYEKWLSVFNQFKVDEETILIGHSMGAGFLVRWLTENKVKVGKVVLVAPFLDPYKEWVDKDFFDFDIDSKIMERAQEVIVFISKDDDKEMLVSVEQLKQKLEGITLKEFTDKGHFVFGSMGTREFPEIIDAILN